MSAEKINEPREVPLWPALESFSNDLYELTGAKVEIGVGKWGIFIEQMPEENGLSLWVYDSTSTDERELVATITASALGVTCEREGPQ